MTNTITDIIVRPIAGTTAPGLKGLNFHHRLSGVDLFAGPNGSGKTTTLLALLGSITGLASTTTDKTRPYLGVPPEGTEVVIHTEQGSWTRDLGATRTTSNAHKQATREAAKLVGTPVVSWDLADWSSGTDGSRRALLAKIAKASDAIEAWTARTAEEKLEARMDDIEMGPGLVVSLIKKYPTAPDASTWLDAAERFAVERAENARKLKREAEARVKERREQQGDQPQGSKAEALATLESLRQHRQSIVTARDAADQHQARIKRTEDELRELGERGKRLKSQTFTAPTDELVRKLEQDLEVATLERTKPLPELAAPAPVPPELAEAVAKRTEELKQAADASGEAHRAWMQARDALQTARTQWQAYQSEQKRVAALQAQAQAPCRHCGQLDPMGHMEGVAVPEQPPSCEPLQDALVAAAADKDQAEYEQARAAEELQSTRTALSRAEGAARSSVEAAQARVARIKAEREEAVSRLATRLEAERARFDARMRQYQDDQRNRKTALDQLRTDYRDCAARLLSLKRATVAAFDPAALEAADASIATAQEAVDEWRDHDRMTAALQEAATMLDAAETRRKACEHLVEAVRATRLEQASACYGPVEQAARRWMTELWPNAPLPYLNGPDDYGAIVRGTEVRLEVLSGAELMMTAAAFSYGFSVVTKAPCRLIMLDDLNKLTPDLRPILLAKLVEAKERGLVDNILITCAVSEDPDLREHELRALSVPGLTIHHLEIDQ